MKDTYQKAVLAHIKDGVAIETIVTGLDRVLALRGHQQLSGAIWQSVLRVIEAEKAAGSTVYVISLAAYQSLKTQITKVLHAINAPDDVTVVVDQTLIGGFVVEGNSNRVDLSYKKQLVDLYRKITT